MHCTNLEANRWPPPPPPSDIASGVATVASSNGDAWEKDMQQDQARKISEEAELIEQPVGFELPRRMSLFIEEVY